MGEVYCATDTKLGRDVALKVLPANVAHDAERLERFRREARVVAALNHPNVITIFSVEECEGIHFLTMELVDGQTLDRVIPEKGLTLAEIVAIGSGIAEALAAAHEKGILHRDLKPANVMVTRDGRVKVLDFGLAKDVNAADSYGVTMTGTGHTQPGVVMGTPLYMSPEQISGRTLDHRSDIFSLGILLHEMATGHRPFSGESSAELISAIMRDVPPSVTEQRTDLPSDFARVIRRCLEKDPRHRFQTARDISNEFRDLARIAPPSTPVPAAASRTAAAPSSASARADEGFWVAVLPFKHAGSNADVAALAEGLAEDIVTGLSRFSYLRVIALSSTSRYAGQAVDVRTAGKDLGARYVMEGSLRQSGNKLRLAVQLVEATTGSHLWAETYERAFHSEGVFELQDELVSCIVSTTADINGVLPRSMGEALCSRPPEDLSPYEAVLRSFAYFHRVTDEEMSAAMAGLNAAVAKSPSYANAWAMLAILSVQRYGQGFSSSEDSLISGEVAARKAIDVAPANHLAWFGLSQVLYFQKDFRAFRNAADRALALNPLDGNSLALHAEMLANVGEWERGLALAERARRFNPHHPGWYWHADFNNAYRQRDYRAALEIANKMNQNSNWGAHALTAAACGQLGDREGGTKALQALLKQRPHAGAQMRADAAKWFDEEHVAHLLEGMQKAGLEIPDSRILPKTEITAAAKPSSGATRADEGFWVAVLPFSCSGSNADLKALAEGLTEEVVTGLSRFSYLRVIARGSTAKYSSASGDVRVIGKTLGARYVMEGSLRQAGSKLRVSVQLVDAESGAHLWAENYERTYSAENIFELQDDLVRRIVSTVADGNGVLPHSMSEVLRSRPAQELTAYEAMLRGFGYIARGATDELVASRDALEAALQKSPNHGDAWAMLSFLNAQDYVHGMKLRPGALDRAEEAARRAVELAPSSHLSYFSLAQVLAYRKDVESFRAAAERTVALNSMDGNCIAFLGELFTYVDKKRGMELADAAKQLNPNHPGWYWFADFYNAYDDHDYRSALNFGRKIALRGHPLAPMLIAAAAGQLGETETGAKAVRDLLKVRPDLPAIMHQQVAQVWNPEYGARFIEGLSKAGMEIPQLGDAAKSP